MFNLAVSTDIMLAQNEIRPSNSEFLVVFSVLTVLEYWFSVLHESKYFSAYEQNLYKPLFRLFQFSAVCLLYGAASLRFPEKAPEKHRAAEPQQKPQAYCKQKIHPQYRKKQELCFSCQRKYMNFRIKILGALIPFCLFLCFMSNTYSRYVADTTGNLKMSFAQWQILVNNEDITGNTSSSVTLNPVIDENKYVESITLNDKPYTKNYITHEDILKGGTLVFKMKN